MIELTKIQDNNHKSAKFPTNIFIWFTEEKKEKKLFVVLI